MPTLTPTTILQQTLAAYRTLFPFVGKMGVDFNAGAPLLLNKQVIAHIRTLPTAANYDATTGYANGATESRELLVDVPILIDSHRHVPVKLEHLNAIKDQKESLQGSIGDMAYVLGKEMVDSITAKFKGSNLSYSQAAATANSDLDVIEQLTTDLNGNGAHPRGRVGLVNSAVAQTLALDPRIASRDYYGQLTGGSGLRMFKGLGGFEAIYEYPGLNANNAATQTFTAATTDIITSAGHGYQNGDRVRFTNAGGALPTGLAAATTYYVRDATVNTFKVSATDGGDAVDITFTGSGTHSVVGFENVTGIFFEAQAIAFRAGVPGQSTAIAQEMGIPITMSMEVESDPISGFALALMKWQQPGTANLFTTLTSLWGSAVGRQAGAAAALTDRSAIILRSA